MDEAAADVTDESQQPENQQNAQQCIHGKLNSFKEIRA
jgi:hypothetical protein